MQASTHAQHPHLHTQHNSPLLLVSLLFYCLSFCCCLVALCVLMRCLVVCGVLSCCCLFAVVAVVCCCVLACLYNFFIIFVLDKCIHLCYHVVRDRSINGALCYKIHDAPLSVAHIIYYYSVTLCYLLLEFISY